VTKAEIVKLLKEIPSGNVQENQRILAVALIYIIENKEKVNFT
jgi:hypothetical protein